MKIFFCTLIWLFAGGLHASAEPIYCGQAGQLFAILQNQKSPTGTMKFLVGPLTNMNLEKIRLHSEWQRQLQFSQVPRSRDIQSILTARQNIMKDYRRNLDIYRRGFHAKKTRLAELPMYDPDCPIPGSQDPIVSPFQSDDPDSADDPDSPEGPVTTHPCIRGYRPLEHCDSQRPPVCIIEYELDPVCTE